MLAQVGLMTIWAAYSGKWAPWLTVGLFGTIVFWASVYPLCIKASEDASTQITVLLVLDAMWIFAGIGVTTLAGVKIRLVNCKTCPQGNDGRRRPFQFSLGYLISWVTAVALILGLVPTALRYDLVLPALRAEWAPLVTVSAGGAAISLAALWAALGRGRPIKRLILLGPPIVLFVGLGYLLDAPLDSLLIIALLQNAWLLATLAVVRVAGYRLVRVRREA